LILTWLQRIEALEPVVISQFANSTNKLANIKNLAKNQGADLLPEKHQSNLSSQFQVDTTREAPM